MNDYNKLELFAIASLFNPSLIFSGEARSQSLRVETCEELSLYRPYLQMLD
jgi:hypothetical protein